MLVQFLAQQDGDDLKIIAYFSHRGNKSQLHHSATMKKSLFYLHVAIQHWRPYICGADIYVRA